MTARQNGKNVLIGNTFPMPLVQAPCRMTPASVASLQVAAHGATIRSYWGHASTLPAANEATGLDLTPARERPALEVDDAGRPVFDGASFDDCWVVCPQYAPGYRPQPQTPVPVDRIAGWHVVHIEWE